MKDIDVRCAARQQLRERHRGDPDTLIVEEMGIWSGSVRVDIAVINGELHGVELKSERDTLIRLPLQAELYSAVFDRVTLVVAEKHRSKAEQLIPNWWGVVTACGVCSDGVRLHQLRAEGFNPDLDPLQLARLLWKAERLAILERHESIKGFRSAGNEALCHRLADVLGLSELRREVRHALKARPTWSGKAIAH